MRIAVMQPYFMPYIGYFQLINSVDKFVVYDDANYMKKGWVNRNNLRINGNKQMITISLNKASQNKLINEIEIIDNFDGIRKTLQRNYSKALYYSEGIELLEKIIHCTSRSLSLFLINSISIILDYIGIEKHLLLSSSINKNNNLKGEDKILDICKQLGAKTYINSIGGADLYSRNKFSENGIILLFLQAGIEPYRQGQAEFMPHLSIIDIIMHNPPSFIKDQLNNYKLI